MATTTLRLTRKAEGVPAFLALNPAFAYATADRKVAWQITLDGALVSTISAGQTVELPIEKGYHTLRLNSDRHHSPERSFEAADGQVVSFSCRAAMLWPSMSRPRSTPTCGYPSNSSDAPRRVKRAARCR